MTDQTPEPEPVESPAAPPPPEFEPDKFIVVPDVREGDPRTPEARD